MEQKNQLADARETMNYLSKGFQFSLLVHACAFLLFVGIGDGIYESSANAPVIIDFCVMKEIQEEIIEEDTLPPPVLPLYAMDFKPMDMMTPSPLIKAEPLQTKPKKPAAPKPIGKPKKVNTEETTSSLSPLKTAENREHSAVSTSDAVPPEPSDIVSSLTGSSFSDDSPVSVPFPAGFSGDSSDAGTSGGVIGGTSSGFKDGTESGFGTAGLGKGVSDLMAFGTAAGPKFRHMETPVYPHKARRLGKEGSVLLRLTIDKNGKLIDIEVLEDSGYGFAEAAVAAVRKSTFIPPTVNGQQISARALLPIKFTLK